MKKLTKVEMTTMESLINRAVQNGQPIPSAYQIGADPVNTEAPAPRIFNKYERTIKDVDGNAVIVDVYAVLDGFDVRCSALQHLIKKALCAGIRGHKDTVQDLQDISVSAIRAIQLHKNRLPKAE